MNEALVGDGLVPLKSVLGEHAEAVHCLNFQADKQWTAFGANHLDLLKRPDVTARVAD